MTAAVAASRPAEPAATSPGDLQGRWQPHPRTAVTASVSGMQVLGAGRAHPDVLLARLHELAPGDPRRAAVRAQVIDGYLPMSASVARRFGGRGEPLADLTQVAAIGLIKAVDRYDATRGVPFASYAIPTMVGEIKRHFRDTGWTVRVPRRMQELGPRLATAVEELAQVLHRAPTTAELAARLGVSPDDVSQARRSAHAYQPRSFEQPMRGTEDLRLIDALSSPDPQIDAVDRRETVRRALAMLPERERHIIAMRFTGEMTQQQIADRIGVSQMQVSRLLTRSLTRLRDAMDADGVAPSVGRAHIAQVAGAGPADSR